MLHIVEDEFGARLAADLRIAWREELERHRSKGAAAGRKPGFQWIGAQGISSGMLFPNLPQGCRSDQCCRPERWGLARRSGNKRLVHSFSGRQSRRGVAWRHDRVLHVDGAAGDLVSWSRVSSLTGASVLCSRLGSFFFIASSLAAAVDLSRDHTQSTALYARRPVEFPDTEFLGHGLLAAGGLLELIFGQFAAGSGCAVVELVALRHGRLLGCDAMDFNDDGRIDCEGDHSASTIGETGLSPPSLPRSGTTTCPP